MPEETVIKSFRGRNAFLSNEYSCLISYESMTYPSVDAAYQAAKSWDIRHRMMCEVASASEVYRFGRKVQLREDWDKARIGIMYDLLTEKFKDAKLQRMLLDTGDAKLVWENTNDRFWGTVKGEGENWLGRHLMSIRAKLREQGRQTP